MHTHEDVSLKTKLELLPVGTTFRIISVDFPCVKIALESTPERETLASGEGWVSGATVRDPHRRFEKDLQQKDYQALIALVEEGSQSKQQGLMRFLYNFFTRGSLASGAV